MAALRQILLLGTILAACVSVATGVTTHDVRIDGDTAHINTTVEIYPEQDTDRPIRMTTSWSLSEDANVRSVSDSDGAITDYTVEQDRVQFTTEITPQEGKEVITIRSTVDGVITESYRELDLVRLQLAGFKDRRPDVPDEVTQVRLETERDLLAESHSFGFDVALDEHGANFSGTEAVNLHLAISDDGRSYDHYRVFGPGNLSVADDLYWVASGVTGFRPPVNKHPIIVLPDDRYERELDAWSAGQYRSGGLIFLKNSTVQSDEAAAVTIHEVVHAYNDHALRWSSTDRAWFDEGTAKYAEFLIKQQQGLHMAEIFGERVSWDCPGRRTCYYEPRGTPDQLWEYYQRNSTAMYSWAPQNAGTAAERRFGYAFAELMIRNLVRQQGPDALHPVYREMRDISAPIRDTRASTEKLLALMGTDFTPCKRPERSAFEDCLDAVNSMQPAIPDPVGPEATRVAIQPITQPANDSSGYGPGSLPDAGTARSLLEAVTAALASVLQRVLAALTNLL